MKSEIFVVTHRAPGHAPLWLSCVRFSQAWVSSAEEGSWFHTEVAACEQADRYDQRDKTLYNMPTWYEKRFVCIERATLTQTVAA